MNSDGEEDQLTENKNQFSQGMEMMRTDNVQVKFETNHSPMQTQEVLLNVKTESGVVDAVQQRESTKEPRKCFDADKPYKCAECAAGFNRAAKLKQHERFIHGSDSIKAAELEENSNEAELQDQRNISDDDYDVHDDDDDIHDHGIDVDVDNDVDNDDYEVRDHGIAVDDDNDNLDQKPYKCDECGAAFSQERVLTLHAKKHSGAMLKKGLCHHCGQFMTCLRTHCLTHKDEKPYKCAFCKAAFRVELKLCYHMLKHKEVKSYLCSVCGDTFKTSMDFRQHLKYTHPYEKPYKCTYGDCEAAFRTPQYLKQHFLVHTGEKPHTCNYCAAGFKSAGGLIYHKTHKCGNAPSTCRHPFLCEFCGKLFTTVVGLSYHNKNSCEHVQSKPRDQRSMCSYCGKTFSVLPQLHVHLRLHTGEKPYKCNECDTAFVTKPMLNRHMLKHTGGKVKRPYKCDKCESAFRYPVHLRTHQLVHTSERPHKCNQCKATFKQEVHLTRHLVIHTGERAFKCEQCNVDFIYKHHLTEHIKKSHM